MSEKFRSKKRKDGSRYAYPIKGKKEFKEPPMKTVKVSKKLTLRLGRNEKDILRIVQELEKIGDSSRSNVTDRLADERGIRYKTVTYTKEDAKRDILDFNKKHPDMSFDAKNFFARIVKGRIGTWKEKIPLSKKFHATVTRSLVTLEEKGYVVLYGKGEIRPATMATELTLRLREKARRWKSLKVPELKPRRVRSTKFVFLTDKGKAYHVTRLDNQKRKE